jgi:uncharacterized delta-60 repeat protein
MKNLVLPLLLCLPLFSIAQFGTLDGDFDADGLRSIDLGESEYAYDVAIQSDGKIVICGSTTLNSGLDMVVARLNPDGSMDNSFGTNGVVVVNIDNNLDGAAALALQPDGKIVVAGHSSFELAVVRLNSNGTLDNSFSFDGIAVFAIGNNSEELTDIVVLNDGKILSAGLTWGGANYDIILLKLNPDGSIDNTFSFDGAVITNVSGNDYVSSMVVDASGSITLAGSASSSPLVVRYNSDGSLDNGFGTGGKRILDVGSGGGSLQSLTVTGSGKILACGNLGVNEDAEMLVVRLMPNGDFDNTFSFDGIAGTDFDGHQDRATDLVLQPDGRILAAGFAGIGANRALALLRLNDDGNFDNAFGTDGRVTTSVTSWAQVNAIALQSDGKVVAAGSANDPSNDILVARYLTGVSVGIGEVVANFSKAMAYPNPITDHSVSVEYELTSEETVSIDLHDLSGKWVSQLQPAVKEAAGAYRKTLSWPVLPTGSYLLRFTTGRGTLAVKLMSGKQ